LIALNEDGTLRWERSYADILRGQQRFLMLDGRPYLVSENNRSSLSDAISVYAIDMKDAELVRIFAGFFAGGSRGFVSGSTPAFVIGDDRMLINVGGGRLVMLDPRAALEAVSLALRSQ
jgi:hypothetical protein